MTFLYRAVRALDRLTDLALLLFFLLLMALGAYTVADAFLVYHAADGADLLQFKPNEDGALPADREIPPDMIAWLAVDDTPIDYPVMQGGDNTTYLNRDPFGSYALSGSIFLDARNAADLSDPYSLIYGHHMEYGKMFGSLDLFMERDFFDAHREGSLTREGEVLRFRIFACVIADGSERAIFSPTEFAGGAPGTLAYLRENALFFEEPEGDRLLALSTCKHPQTTERFVVFAAFL